MHSRLLPARGPERRLQRRFPVALAGLGLAMCALVACAFLLQRQHATHTRPRTRDVSKVGMLRVGERLDASDGIDGKWCEAEVRKTRPGELFVHFRGWGEQWDEWIAITNSHRVAPLHTHTKRDGTQIGPDADQAQTSPLAKLVFPTPVPTAKDDAEGGWLKDHYYMVAAGTPDAEPEAMDIHVNAAAVSVQDMFGPNAVPTSPPPPGPPTDHKLKYKNEHGCMQSWKHFVSCWWGGAAPPPSSGKRRRPPPKLTGRQPPEIVGVSSLESAAKQEALLYASTHPNTADTRTALSNEYMNDEFKSLPKETQSAWKQFQERSDGVDKALFSETASKECQISMWAGDGACDIPNNLASCGFDGGDCCERSCTAGRTYNCGMNGYDCRDPTLMKANRLTTRDEHYQSISQKPTKPSATQLLNKLAGGVLMSLGRRRAA